MTAGQKVRHKVLGVGTVIADNGATVVARFRQGIHEVPGGELTLVVSLSDKLAQPQWDKPLAVINRVQAGTILSANSTWGVFARSKIELLPHQMWVCKKVSESWPARWLVADDVGLGKTVEAGMSLLSFFSRHILNRVMIIAPASLVPQWQYRMRTMFDLRFECYSQSFDKPSSDYWGASARYVIASLQTLRADKKGRHQRLLDSPPWDVIIVDEAHHLNADEAGGATLGYKLIEKLSEAGKTNTVLFFTGTPHRGKDYGFVSLLSLLRPDLCNPKHPISEVYPHLPDIVIRNNKANVTDMQGKELFSDPVVNTFEYRYSPEEAAFYEQMTRFILEGRAYAGKLSVSEGNVVMLVLIAMQKLASSSVAAIRKALKGRLSKIGDTRKSIKDLVAEQQALTEDEGDRRAEIEEDLAEKCAALSLIEGEETYLRHLVASADRITDETKIRRILEVIDTQYAGESVLFFTEYKATQSLLMTALIKRYGRDCVTFINGDGEAKGVFGPNGEPLLFTEQREQASDYFNHGDKRFLVSTEAAGEGIDLQQHCHVLCHVDMPWNPMRMHQRVGRLNRYGQKQQVRIINMRNPDTLETFIWDKLQAKIERINAAMSKAMDTPEDMLQLVLGMTSPSFFDEVYSEALRVDKNARDSWFDSKTKTFGGKDSLDAVTHLVGNSGKFIFSQVSDKLPQVDLPDLQPFFEGALVLNNRRPDKKNGAISFIKPQAWPVSFARERFDDMTFNRNDKSEKAYEHLLGMGHQVFDSAVDCSLETEAMLASLPLEMLPLPVAVFKIFDRVTTDRASNRFVLVAVEQSDKDFKLIPDWKLLKQLNALSMGKDMMSSPSTAVPLPPDFMHEALRFLRDNLGQVDHGFKIPDIEEFAILVPSSEAHS